jgi:hypothetical protein
MDRVEQLMAGWLVPIWPGTVHQDRAANLHAGGSAALGADPQRCLRLMPAEQRLLPCWREDLFMPVVVVVGVPHHLGVGDGIRTAVTPGRSPTMIEISKVRDEINGERS